LSVSAYFVFIRQFVRPRTRSDERDLQAGEPRVAAETTGLQILPQDATNYLCCLGFSRGGS
jgi:hypothetical protein